MPRQRRKLRPRLGPRLSEARVDFLSLVHLSLANFLRWSLECACEMSGARMGYLSLVQDGMHLGPRRAQNSRMCSACPPGPAVGPSPIASTAVPVAQSLVSPDSASPFPARGKRAKPRDVVPRRGKFPCREVSWADNRLGPTEMQGLQRGQEQPLVHREVRVWAGLLSVLPAHTQGSDSPLGVLPANINPAVAQPTGGEWTTLGGTPTPPIRACPEEVTAVPRVTSWCQTTELCFSSSSSS